MVTSGRLPGLCRTLTSFALLKVRNANLHVRAQIENRRCISADSRTVLRRRIPASHQRARATRSDRPPSDAALEIHSPGIGPFRNHSRDRGRGGGLRLPVRAVLIPFAPRLRRIGSKGGGPIYI